MIAPANRNYTADEPLIAEACQKRAADITAQADDEADPIEVMPAGEPVLRVNRLRCACAFASARSFPCLRPGSLR